jgi:Cof subfamily protein (haloacid dehalogenase superfamily)
MMKNVYITDLDHTFLRNDLSVSEFSKSMWNKMAKNSIASIATARTYKKTMQFMGGVDINAPMILLDGALIATVDKKIIETKFIDKDIADSIIDEGAKFGIYPFILALADDELNEVFLHSETLNSIQTQVLKNYSCDDHLHLQKNICSTGSDFKIVYMGQKEIIEALALHVEAIFKDELKYILAPEAYTKSYFLTILHKDADKSHGIKSVSQYADFELSKLSVFGDNINDIGMFELANTAIAMANAQERVKQKADIVLKHTNDEDGVAKYLQGVL